MIDDLKKMITQAEARLRADGQWPPAGGEGYDLNNPQLRAELLDMDIVNFKLNPLPPEIQKFLDKLDHPLTPSEEDVVCDYLDRVLNLAPDFCTCPGADNSLWVVDTEEGRQRKMQDPKRRRRMRDTASEFTPQDLSAYDLQQWRDMVKRLDGE